MTMPERIVPLPVEDLRAALAGIAGDPMVLPEDVQHELMRLAVKSYAAAWQEHRAQPLSATADITATEAVVAASALLRASNIELFELAMWQTQAGA